MHNSSLPLNISTRKLCGVSPTIKRFPDIIDCAIFKSSQTIAISESRVPSMDLSLMLADPIMNFLSSTIISLL